MMAADLRQAVQSHEASGTAAPDFEPLISATRTAPPSPAPWSSAEPRPAFGLRQRHEVGIGAECFGAGLDGGGLGLARVLMLEARASPFSRVASALACASARTALACVTVIWATN